MKGIPLVMMISWTWSWDGGPAYAVHATLGSVIAHEILHAFDFHRRKSPVDPDPNIDEWLWIKPDSWKRLETRIECVARFYARSFWRKVRSYGSDVAVQVRGTRKFPFRAKKKKTDAPHRDNKSEVETYCLNLRDFTCHVQFDWNMTRNEIVADIGALQISHRTWHTLTNGKDRSLSRLEGLRPSQLFFISAAQVTISTSLFLYIFHRFFSSFYFFYFHLFVNKDNDLLYYSRTYYKNI